MYQSLCHFLDKPTCKITFFVVDKNTKKYLHKMLKKRSSHILVNLLLLFDDNLLILKIFRRLKKQ